MLLCATMSTTAAFNPGSCPGQEDLSTLDVSTGYRSNGEYIIAPKNSDGSDNLVLYEGADQIVRLAHPSWTTSIPANMVHIRALPASVTCCTGAMTAGSAAGGVLLAIEGGGFRVVAEGDACTRRGSRTAQNHCL